MALSDYTVLSIDGIEIPEFAARGITETFTPLQQSAQMRRTINGALVDLSLSQFRKYAVVLQCTDQQPPAFDGVWPGQTVTVDCITELSYLTSGGAPAKTVVPGSSRTEGDFTFYRPRLTMKIITPWSIMRDEWGAIIGWTLELEEV